MKRVHPEFAYQSRELEGQIEGTLGDPPNKKNYQMMVDALVSEYAGGSGIDDVNLMAFALVDKIKFLDPKGLLREAADYEARPGQGVRHGRVHGRGRRGDVRVDDGKPSRAGAPGDHHRLPLQAPAALGRRRPVARTARPRNDEGDDENEDEEGMVSDDFTGIFDGEGERE
jgi:hypothetical protein